MNKGLFITYEGKDGSGKSTHSEALYKNLKESGHKVKLVHFPRYESSIGGLIGKMLSGEVPMLESFEAFQMLYVADQLDFQEELKRYIDEGYIVIADRYDLSTIAYYTSKKDIPTVIGYNYIRKWQSDLLEPDLTFIFDYNQDLNERRKDMDKECDAIESDKQINDKIRDVYKELYYILNDCKEISKTTREVHLVDTNFDFAHNSVAINNVVKHHIRRNL